MPRPTAQKAPINLSVLLVILYSALFKGLFSPSSIRINKGAQKDWAMQYSLTHTHTHTHRTHTHTHTHTRLGCAGDDERKHGVFLFLPLLSHLFFSVSDQAWERRRSQSTGLKTDLRAMPISYRSAILKRC